MNNKGFITGILLLIIVSFIAIIFLAAWKYGINQVNNEISSINTGDSLANISYASGETFGYYNQSMDELKNIAAALILAFILATFFLAYYSQKHPIWFFVYLLISVILVIFSVYLSNSYEEISSNDVLGSTIQEFTLASFFMNHLTSFVVVIIFFGIIFSLGGMIIRRDYGA